MLLLEAKFKLHSGVCQVQLTLNGMCGREVGDRIVWLDSGGLHSNLGGGNVFCAIARMTATLSPSSDAYISHSVVISRTHVQQLQVLSA
jgi:hypothetical protein